MKEIPQDLEYKLKIKTLKDKIRQRIWRCKNRDKSNAYCKNYYLKNKALIKEKRKKFRVLNRIKDRERQRVYRYKNYGKLKILYSEYYKKNRKRLLENRRNRKQWIDVVFKLKSRYIKTLLAKSLNISYKEVPKELIEIKRKHIELKRLIKQKGINK